MLLRNFIFGLAFLLTFTISFLVTPSVQADFNSDYQGFLKTYDEYRGAYENYITTRNQYLTYGTLTSKTDALNAVKTFLIKRNDVLQSYISLLRARGTEGAYTSFLEDESSFLRINSEKIPAVGSLDDAVDTAQEVEARQVSFQITSRKIVTNLNLNKINTLRQRYQDLVNQASSMIDTLKSQNKDVTTLERWLLEAKNKELLSQQKIAEVITENNSFEANDTADVTKAYNSIQFTSYEAVQYLKEAVKFMQELSDTLKYGNY